MPSCRLSSHATMHASCAPPLTRGRPIALCPRTSTSTTSAASPLSGRRPMTIPSPSACKQHLQLLPDAQRVSYAKARVTVRRYLDGRLSVGHKGRGVGFRILAAPPPPVPKVKPHAGRPGRPRVSSTWKPQHDHPWKKSYAEEQRRKQLKIAGVTFSLNAEGDRIADHRH